MKDPTVREKIQTLNSVEEIEGFEWGCNLFRTMTPEIRNLLELRRNQILNGDRK